MLGCHLPGLPEAWPARFAHTATFRVYAGKFSIGTLCAHDSACDRCAEGWHAVRTHPSGEAGWNICLFNYATLKSRITGQMFPETSSLSEFVLTQTSGLSHLPRCGHSSRSALCACSSMQAERNPSDPRSPPEARESPFSPFGSPPAKRGLGPHLRSLHAALQAHNTLSGIPVDFPSGQAQPVW